MRSGEERQAQVGKMTNRQTTDRQDKNMGLVDQGERWPEVFFFLSRAVVIECVQTPPSSQSASHNDPLEKFVLRHNWCIALSPGCEQICFFAFLFDLQSWNKFWTASWNKTMKNKMASAGCWHQNMAPAFLNQTRENICFGIILQRKNLANVSKSRITFLQSSCW